MRSLKDKLADPNYIVNMQMNVIPSPVVTQALAAAGTDAVMIDMEHGAVGWPEAHAMIAATQGTGCSPLVRIPEISEAYVKRVMDLGAEGIVFPLVRTAEDARRAVASLHYPPAGTRGWGPFIAHSRWDVPIMDYVAKRGKASICCLLLETAEAVENAEEICAVPGIDIAVIAQFDLSSSLGIPGQFDHPDFLSAEKKLETAILSAGLPMSAIAFTEDRAKHLIARGYRVLAGFDVLWLKAAVTASVSWGGNARS